VASLVVLPAYEVAVLVAVQVLPPAFFLEHPAVPHAFPAHRKNQRISRLSYSYSFLTNYFLNNEADAPLS
jgi:hypothetical protein